MRALALIAIAVATARCGPALCTHCPNVSGIYALQSSGPMTNCDGTPAAALPMLGAPPSKLDLEQNGSHLSSGSSTGELTDDGDFVLHASTDDQSHADLSISAHFTAPGSLRGQSVSNFEVEGPRVRDPSVGSDGPLIQTWVNCTLSWSFSGDRT
jgi:hypothetical protein